MVILIIFIVILYIGAAAAGYYLTKIYKNINEKLNKTKETIRANHKSYENSKKELTTDLTVLSFEVEQNKNYSNEINKQQDSLNKSLQGSINDLYDNLTVAESKLKQQILEINTQLKIHIYKLEKQISILETSLTSTGKEINNNKKQTEKSIEEINKALTDYSEEKQEFAKEINKQISKVKEELIEYTKKPLELKNSFYSNTAELQKVLQKNELDSQILLSKVQESKEVYENLILKLERYDKLENYLFTATQKLEQRPEQVKRQLEQIIKEHKIQLDFVTKEQNNLKREFNKSSDFLFKEISNLRDTSVHKKNPYKRY